MKRLAGLLAFAAVLTFAVIGGLSRTGQASAPVLTRNIGTARPAAVGGAWALIQNDQHQPQGLGSLSCDTSTGFLIVNYAAPLSKVVGSAVMTDEWWSRKGIIAGVSVGLTYSVIYFTQLTADGPKPLSCAALDPDGNIWIQVEGT